MTFKRIVIAIVVVVLIASAGVGLAQRGDRQFLSEYERGYVPLWENPGAFEEEVFTFVRVQYSSGYSGGFDGGDYGRRRRGGFRGGWATDFPDSDLNFSFRLQQLTSLKVNPHPISLTLTDDRMFDHPFLYMIEPGSGRLMFTQPEILALRRYLLNGGFLMVDDFWGDWEYQVFYDQIKRVFPDREPVELELDHEIFQCVYRLKEKPQVPSIGSARGGRSYGRTWEGGRDTQTPHYKAIYDDHGRMMVIICHNTDLGDGWEREGEDEWYFTEFSEKLAYPMGINIVVYAMTH